MSGSLNASKCETSSFGSTHQNTLTFHNKPVPQKSCSKYFGVFIDSKLTFKDHINHVVKKLSRLTYRVRDIYPNKYSMWFYNAYARFVFCYGLLVYGSTTRMNFDVIELAQRRRIRAHSFRRNSTVCKKFCGKLNWILFLSCSFWMFCGKFS